MLLPQPSFSLAVINESHLPASMLVLSAKLAMMFYLWREYRVNPFACCLRRLRAVSQTEQMSEEIEM